MRRRQFLAVAGLVGLAGCGDSPLDDRTTASSFPSATNVWHLTPPYPFRFEGELLVPETTVKGWLLADPPQKRVHVAGDVVDGGPVSVYFSDQRIERARVPPSPFETLSDVSSFEETIEYDEGGGSFFFDAERDTAIDLVVEVERV